MDTQVQSVGYSWEKPDMGKGDKRSKRGKLFKGTFGKRRVKPQKAAKKIRDAAAAGA
jgi:ribosomal small subunit protein bTHX